MNLAILGVGIFVSMMVVFALVQIDSIDHEPQQAPSPKHAGRLGAQAQSRAVKDHQEPSLHSA